MLTRLPYMQVWGTTCAMCAIFAFVFVPETKALTLEQVDKMMEEVPAIRSSKWRAHDTFVHEMGASPEQFKLKHIAAKIHVPKAFAS